MKRADEVFEQTRTVLPKARMEHTLRKLDHLRKDVARCLAIKKRMDETGKTKASLSDPGARSMPTTPRVPHIAGCNPEKAD